MSELGMTREEREAFLAEVHVGVVAIAEEGRAPLTVPVVRLRARRRDPLRHRAELPQGDPPQEGHAREPLCADGDRTLQVRERRGPASVGPVKDFERDVRGIAHRYLGPEIGEMYLAAPLRIGRNMARCW
jgi:hypothetical protein